MNRGYRANNVYSYADFARTGRLANFTDMLGMTSGHEMRGEQQGTNQLFPQYINPKQALGKQQKKKQVPDRTTQTSVVNHPGSKSPAGGSQLTEGVMKSNVNGIPAKGQQWNDAHYGYGRSTVNFEQGLKSEAGIPPKSNPYKTQMNQGMPGDTHIMNPSPEVGNPYNLLKKGEPTYPTRIRKKTPYKTLKRGSV